MKPPEAVWKVFLSCIKSWHINLRPDPDRVPFFPAWREGLCKIIVWLNTTLNKIRDSGKNEYKQVCLLICTSILKKNLHQQKLKEAINDGTTMRRTYLEQYNDGNSTFKTEDIANIIQHL